MVFEVLVTKLVIFFNNWNIINNSNTEMKVLFQGKPIGLLQYCSLFFEKLCFREWSLAK